MTQNNSANVKLSNSQLNILRATTKNATEVTLKLLSNMTPVVQLDTANSIDETNFPHKLLLKFQSFIKLMQIITLVMKIYQKLNYLTYYNQENFLVDFLVHY